MKGKRQNISREKMKRQLEMEKVATGRRGRRDKEERDNRKCLFVVICKERKKRVKVELTEVT